MTRHFRGSPLERSFEPPLLPLAQTPYELGIAPRPYRPERLVLASDFAEELTRKGLEVAGVQRLPSDNYQLELVPVDPADDEPEGDG
jgi:hypothetical protein